MRALLRASALLVLAALPASAADTIPPEILKKVKAATVFIQVDAQIGQGTGSGFMIRVDGTTGWLVTNHHVVSMKDNVDVELDKPKITCVFHSGLKDEWKAKGTVVAADTEHDLAVVKMESKDKTFPVPLALVVADKVDETSPVFICGFPFGAQIASSGKNPELSIGNGTVSSLRHNDKGELINVQINGALNPGNSGGPVVTGDGKLVGVAVTSIIGRGVGFAVPHTIVAGVLRGKLDNRAQFANSLDEADRLMRFRKIDPYGKLKEFHIHTAKPDKPKVDASKPPADLSKLPGFSRKTLTAVPGESHLVEAKFTDLKIGATLWVQPEWVDEAGKRHLGTARAVKIPPLNAVAERDSTGAQLGRREADGMIRGLTDLTGKALPPLSVKPIEPDTPPPNWIDLAELNRTAKEMVGKKACVHALQFSSQNSLRGHFVECYFDDDNTTPSDIEFAVDKFIYDSVSQFRTRNRLGSNVKLAVRLTGEVRNATDEAWQFLVVDKVEFLANDGSVAWKIDRRDPHGEKVSREYETRKLNELIQGNETYLTRLEHAPRSVTGKFDLFVKADGVEKEAASTDADAPLQRLKFQRDHRGELVKNLVVYIDEELAKTLSTLYKNDPKLKEDDVHLTLNGWRYENRRRVVVATVDSLRVMTGGRVRKVKHELSTKSNVDYTVDALPPDVVSPVSASTPKTEPSEALLPESSRRAVSTPAAPTKTESGSSNTILIVAVAAMALAGLGLLVFLLMRSKSSGGGKPAKKRKIARREYDDDEDDEDYEDEDDAPRRRPRPRKR